ncbi:putative Lipopolysaccharide heptosyltransferase II [Nitrospira sp. KM1]|uniref:lipopolysaccharide heptosyltransferase II n=1 Tax=Nitrospira sp. KM1 TaxID=1936990 RepID=UPI0013A78995|nr:lipopolysaccharide heptosyltransferase II [Nitrospira sp. KM1]BCA54245.1 putative Lipopolysaccharide heptosyltransferase II [Nitrospira sp. KM1]
MEDYRRILFVKPSSLGDIVHAMPALAALRRRYPAAAITWLVKREWSAIVERIEGVHRTWSVDRGFAGWLSQIPALRKEQFDLAVDLQGLLRSAFMAWGSGAGRRVGFARAREGSPWFYSDRIEVPTPDMHAVDRYLLIAKALGATLGGNPEFSFRIPDSDHITVDRLLRDAGLEIGRPWIAMNVSARWPTKRWPAGSFAAVADRIQEERLGAVVFTGGPAERGDAERVKALMRTKPMDITGASSVGVLPALLSRASVLVTNDSGPMHVAAAVGTPVVAVFGPTSPARTGPYGSGHRVLKTSIPCSPCFSRTCRNAVTLECLHLVSPEQVMAAVESQFAGRMASK